MDQKTLQIVRPGIGLIQGLMLLSLYRASLNQVWPATNGYLIAPLVLTTLFVPIIAISGLGNARLKTLLAWLIVAIVLCAGLTWYDIFRNPTDGSWTSDALPYGAPRTVASFELCLALPALLFIAHALVLASDADRLKIARYPTYFDISWKHGVQAVLAGLFVGVFWAILVLGAQLFSLIKITIISDVISRDYFWVPVTAIAAGYALHLTDSRAALTRGARTLVLFLLSWLLPVMLLIAIGFVIALPFTGLQVLWSTRHAAGILLVAAAMLVFLINAAYQDGNAEQPLVLRASRLGASLVLLPLVALAGVALLLRVQQYGWSPQRVVATAVAITAAFYALGYLYAVLRFGLSLKGLERVNIVTAFAMVGIVLLLFTPLVDPDRISVDSQIARLNSGKVAPEQFDFVFLKFDSGRYGRSALARLVAKGGDDPTTKEIVRRASLMQAQKTRYKAVETAKDAITPEQRAAQIAVIYPQGATLPDSFIHQAWDDGTYDVFCLNSKRECEAMLLDLDGDGQDEVVLLGKPAGSAHAFRFDGKTWQSLGLLDNIYCTGVREALRQGNFELKDEPLKEIVVNGTRLRVGQYRGCKPPPAKAH